MAVTNATPVVEFVGNNITTQFSFSFKILTKAELNVFEDGVLKTLDTDFTINNDLNTVTFTSAPTSSVVVRFQRIVSVDRSTDYIEGGGLSSKTLDDDLDRVVMMIQDQQYDVMSRDEGVDEWNAGNERLINLSDPIDDQDAVTKGYVGSYKTAAETAATNASTSETNASNSAIASANEVALAQAEVTYAEEWANKAENSLVSVAAGGVNIDDFSAMHWSKKSEAFANSSVSTPLLPARNSSLNQDAVTQGTSTRTGMSSTIYTGNSGTQSIDTKVDMSTGDFGGLVWLKKRNGIESNVLFDTIRQSTNRLRSDTTSAEDIVANTLTDFTSSGFNVGNSGTVNGAFDYVAWSWQTDQKVTGTTNRNKAYTSHYNTNLGFSIVGYVGDGVDGHEIPHHLGAVPELSITKARDTISPWIVQSPLIGDSTIGDFLTLEESDALLNSASVTLSNNNSTVQLGAHSALNQSLGNMVSYHFTSKASVSKVGKYIGTGVAGNYVDCGFKAGWVMVKNLTSASGWIIYDGIRSDNVLYPDQNGAESAWTVLDFVDDGFVVSDTGGTTNSLNHEFIFLAFADTSKDATRAWTDNTYPTTADTLSIQQDTLISFANGFSASGQVDTQENVGAGITYTLGAGHEDKKYWLYKDLAGSYDVSEYRPLEGITRNDADKYGVESPLDSSLRTTAKHFDYESSTGVALASSIRTVMYAWHAFETDYYPIAGNTTHQWSSATTTGWLQYKHTEKRILKSYRIRNTDTSDSFPRDYTIEGSNDGKSWNIIDTVLGDSAPVRLWNSLKSVAANNTAYLYHRINITANNGDVSYVAIEELEFNTILPSDYFLIEEGKMYNSSDVAIERTYLAELMTNSDGEVSWYKNLPIAKQRFSTVDVHNDLTVHGEIVNEGVATAWVTFDGTQNPPLILDSYNVKDIVDLGVGNYRVDFETPMNNEAYSVSAIAGNSWNIYADSSTRNNKYIIIKTSDSTHTAVDDVLVSVTIHGGKK